MGVRPVGNRCQDKTSEQIRLFGSRAVKILGISHFRTATEITTLYEVSVRCKEKYINRGLSLQGPLNVGIHILRARVPFTDL